MTAFLFSKICIESGLPKGVLNIVHGLGKPELEILLPHIQTLLLCRLQVEQLQGNIF